MRQHEVAFITTFSDKITTGKYIANNMKTFDSSYFNWFNIFFTIVIFYIFLHCVWRKSPLSQHEKVEFKHLLADQ